MTDQNITELDPAGTLDGTEVVYVVKSSQDRQTTTGDIVGLLTDELNGKQPLATVLTNTTASFTTALETKLNATPVFLSYVKTSDQTVNSTTYVTSTGLSSTTLEANSYYRFEATIMTASDAATDLRWRLNRSGLSDAIFQFTTDLDNNQAAIFTWLSGIGCAGSGTGTTRMCNAIGYIKTGTDTGTVEIQFSQQTAGAGDTTMKDGSMMMLRKVG